MSALKNIRVLDLSRVLAGPSCTQILADLGADIIKVERPGEGDDTRQWGPPFLQDKDGNDTTESAYYLSANRGKRSVAIDITTEQGQDLIHRLIAQSDILIENFKTGGLDKYGLGYARIKQQYPGLIYCSITGFGQDGPLASEPGYDFLAQAMGGLMAATGVPDGEPMKAGVALSDIMTGLYAAIGILAALHHREKTGEGQHVDLALLDCTLASMTNIAQYFLTSGTCAPRLGNAHSTIVPYQAFAAQDGHIIIAIGNDRQFTRFADAIGHEEWARDERFITNRMRVKNRDILIPLIATIIKTRSCAAWLDLFHQASLSVAPVNRMDQVFAMPQIQAREMKISLPHPLTDGAISLVGSPLKLSGTPVSYDKPPPVCGEHSAAILRELLGLGDDDIAALEAESIIGSFPPSKT